MMRRILPRFPYFRTLVPRIARPLLPVTSRISTPTSRVLTRPLRISPFRHIHTTSARSSSSSSPPPDAKEPPTLSQRLKELIKAYGWYAVGVYAAVSAADFVVAFIGVNLLGADYVASIAASAKTWFHNLVYSRPPEPGRDEVDEVSKVVATGQEGLYAMFLLAFAVHKTLFLPVRIGVTAAFTPRFVKWLRARGWAGGEGTRRAMQEMRGRLRDRN